MRRETVVIHEPLDSSNFAYMARLASTIPKNVSVQMESNSNDESWDLLYRVGDMVEVRHQDENEAKALAEYIGGCINLKTSITLALSRSVGALLDVSGPPDDLGRVLEELQTAPAPTMRLDDMLHDAFQLKGSFCLPYTSSMDAALMLFRAILPGYGYLISHSGSTEGFHRQFYVAKVLRPAKDPRASITDGDSWATHYEAGAITEAMALVIAVVTAKIANP